MCLPKGVRNGKKIPRHGNQRGSIRETNGGNEEQTHGDTYINHPILRRVGVRAAHVQPISIPHWLDHPYVIPTVEVLRKKGKENWISYGYVRRNVATAAWRGGEEGASVRGHGFFRKLYRAGSRGKGFHRGRSRRASPYFAANWRAGNKLVLSSRREYLRGPYTSPMRARWIPNEAAINGGELSALKCDRYVCKMNR